MVDIFIPSKTMQGRAINSPGNPNHGRILLKNPSGDINGNDPEPGYGLSWDQFKFAGLDPTERDPNSGFIPILLHSDTKRIYLAKYPYSHDGVTVFPSNSNDGLTPLTPKLDEYEAFRLIEPGRSNHLYLRSDENHNGYTYNIDDSGTGSSKFRNALAHGESYQKPVVITWYGNAEGNRPRVRPPISLSRSSGHSYLWWDGIHFYSEEQDLNSPNFTGERGGALQYLNVGSSGVVIQDCEFTGAELKLQDQVGSGMHNYIIHRCIGHHIFVTSSSYSQEARPSFSYVSRVTGVHFTENVAKWSGWHPHVEGAGANQFNHWLYFGETDASTRVDDSTVKRNIIFEPSAHAWQLRGGGTAEENIIVGASIGPSFGYMDRRNYEKGVVADGAIFHSFRNITLKMQSMYRTEDSCQNGVCSRARWGHSNVFINPNVSHVSDGDIIALVKDNAWDDNIGRLSQGYAIPEVNYGISDLSPYPQYTMTITDRVTYHVDSSTQGDDLNLLDPTRDLGGYFSLLAETAVTDLQAVEFLASRPKSSWDTQYAPTTIHTWIYAGYQPEAA